MEDIKLKTGIPGVDEMIGGGFPDKSVIIVSGSPGIGKSNFAMQWIYAGVMEYDEPGIYITVEDIPANIRKYAVNFGWDIEKYEKKNKLAVVAQPIYAEEPSKEEKKKAREKPITVDGKNETIGRETLTDTIKRIGAKRIVLDSVTLFKYLFKDDIARRVNLLNFIKMMKDHNCTTLMVAEQHESTSEIEYADEHFLADALIIMYWSQHRDKFERIFRIVKVRGNKIIPDARPFEISENGVVVYSTQVPLTLSD